MFNFRKIGILMLAAALFCILRSGDVYAGANANDSKCAKGFEWNASQNCCISSDDMMKFGYGECNGKAAAENARFNQPCKGMCNEKTQKCVNEKCVAKDPASSSSTNATQPQSAVTGCSSNQGIFSGLIATGSKVFNGLRDLIYVVAGFGIIGVAVGGFFGNLNWKWLGAIVISLVVIATTGELISAITGCENFTTSMITDTLK